ncbi:MAG TPA: TadE family protein [Candidatus Dormibacteraeota bacterium]|jgi:Flp pilus assembly protein TadG|nr:TadE family protein [Candidatus Dormibacteraeota bacterium]
MCSAIPPRRPNPHPGRTLGSSSGQALVEFSLVVGAFLLVLLGAVSASIYTVERIAAVTAVAAGARAAATPASGANPNDVDLHAAQPAIEAVAGHAMFGTQIDYSYVGAGASCGAPGGQGTVRVCVGPAHDPNDPAGVNRMVAVRMVGAPRNPVPTFGIFSWTLDVEVQVHQVTFLP